MLKRDELSDPASCINKAADDEPVFVLRGQDYLASETVKHWASLAETAGRTPPEKIAEARKLAEAMRLWPDRKLPD